ncbi:Nucleotide-binding universal stress protein, UspA family [Pustulibacterium marinum]|uniref:Nucleotide-binding universal stress protein, UspA family n=1 Tax=Pustulibacterium marinum TaxID=1224947 RepID=A0A1I7GC88_9FLAO|nr:universal stress protein [Pustulibacterium marinum]SFU46053.1 Nucleotide-binding universal stress protein, UspA family [Pustulibacterium marinum]
MNTLVYATDYSKNSVPALKYAYSLSQLTNKKLIVLNILEYPTIWNSDVPKPEFEDYEKGAENAYKNLLQEFCEKQIGGHLENAIYQVKKGDDVENAILDFSKEHQPDALILGVHGMNPVQEFFMGSTTQSIISSSIVPVIAVPENVQSSTLKTMAFATALKKEDVITIKKIASLFETVKPILKVVHIAHKKSDEKLAEIAEFKELLNDEVSGLVNSFDIIYNEDRLEGLIGFVTIQKADMIIMKERKSQNNKLKERFQKDLVKRMEAKTKIPLLSFKS